MKAGNRIVIAGGSGFLGQRLAVHFIKTGSEVVVLSRSRAPAGQLGRWRSWDAHTAGSWEQELEGAIAVINLTGKSVNCRYTALNRREVLDSRVNSTRVLGQAIGRCSKPPQVWLNASTATIYRHNYGEAWDENGDIAPTAAAKDRFSIDVAKAWERAFDEVATPNTRKVALRMAMVLGLGNNSVFPALRRLTSMGFGGKMASGKQFVSWIHELDYCRAVEWLIDHSDISGPVNVASPQPLPNGEMMRILRQTCGAPFGLSSAGWVLEIGAFFLRTETELIIKSRRVVPRHLLESGFGFEFPRIQEAFDELTRRADEHAH